MRYGLRQIGTDSKFSRELKAEAIGRAVPEREVERALEAEGVQTIRERKLNMVVTVLVIIAMNLYTHISISGVIKKLWRGLRYDWPGPDYVLPGGSADAKVFDCPLRNRSPIGVMQELYGLLIAHYAVQCLMHQADLNPDQLNFVNVA